MNAGLPPAGAAVRAPVPGVSVAALALGASLALIGLHFGGAAVGALCLVLLVVAVLLHPMIGVGSLLVTAPIFLILTPFIPKGVPVSFLLLALTVLGLSFRRVFEVRAVPFRWTALDVAAAFLLLNGLLYIPLAANLKTGVYGYHELLRLFLIYFVIRLLRPGRREAAAAFWATGAVAFVVLAYGCVQRFWNYEWVMVHYDLIESLRDYAAYSSTGLRRAYSLIGSPLSLGFLGMMGSLTAVSLLAFGDRDRAKSVAPLLLAAGLGASAFSFTRSSWIGTATGIGLFTLFSLRGRNLLHLVLVPLVLGFVVMRVVPDAAERVGNYALTIVSSDPTDTNFHYVALFEAADFFWNHKLGVGLGSASFAGMQHGGGVKFWSENAYFLVGIQTGMQGLIGLVVFLIAGLREGRLAIRRPGAPVFDRRIGALVFMGCAAFGLAGMSLPALLDVSAFAPLWVAAALAVNAREAAAAGVD